jgi:hypothetical protein
MSLKARTFTIPAKKIPARKIPARTIKLYSDGTVVASGRGRIPHDIKNKILDIKKNAGMIHQSSQDELAAKILNSVKAVIRNEIKDVVHQTIGA